jgi:hypothetical protein
MLRLHIACITLGAVTLLADAEGSPARGTEDVASKNTKTPDPNQYDAPKFNGAGPASRSEELLATVILHARVSEPEQMTGMLNELRLESAAHIGRLDEEERSEMMTAMRRAGVALGDRNKLRLLGTGSMDRVGSLPPVPAGRGPRRAQDARVEESATNKQLKKQVGDHAGTAQPSGEQADGGLGLSGDSAIP